MHTSHYLEQAIFYQPSHATDQLLRSTSEALFQRPGQKSWIEVYYQQPMQQKLRSSAPALDCRQGSELYPNFPSFLDESRSNSLDGDPPPTYESSPCLLRRVVLDLQDVQRIETVSALIAAFHTSADTQRHKGNGAHLPHLVCKLFRPQPGSHSDKSLVVLYARNTHGAACWSPRNFGRLSCSNSIYFLNFGSMFYFLEQNLARMR